MPLPAQARLLPSPTRNQSRSGFQSKPAQPLAILIDRFAHAAEDLTIFHPLCSFLPTSSDPQHVLPWVCVPPPPEPPASGALPPTFHGEARLDPSLLASRVVQALNSLMVFLLPSSSRTLPFRLLSTVGCTPRPARRMCGGGSPGPPGPRGRARGSSHRLIEGDVRRHRRHLGVHDGL